MNELWRLVVAFSNALARSMLGGFKTILAELRRGGKLAITPEVTEAIKDYIEAGINRVRPGIGRAISLIEPGPDFLRDAMADAYRRRWADGLSLSERLWGWQDTVQQEVSAAIRRGIAAEKGVDALVMEMQRAIESAAGKKFAIETRYREDWAHRLADVGRRAATDPASAQEWRAMVARAEKHIGKLKEGGTKRQAEAALNAIRDAVNKGSVKAIDKALKYWIYDRQLYSLRRIARTEMATAHHRAIIATTKDNPAVIGYEWKLASTHPEPDICDHYANVELGLGKGIWPKDKVPNGKAHPQCMCSILSRVTKNKDPGELSYDDLLGEMRPKEKESFLNQALHP